MWFFPGDAVPMAVRSYAIYHVWFFLALGFQSQRLLSQESRLAMKSHTINISDREVSAGFVSVYLDTSVRFG